MAKEEVLEAVVEEPTEAVVEEPAAVVEEPVDIEEELSPWYYFFSTGCGWCKKSSPIVDELIDDGHDILMLDLAEPDNQKLSQELKTEYGVQCGTPWFINADTGKGICGFREKDMLEIWLDGKDVPAPPRPTGPPPKVPFQGSTNKEEIAWKKTYNTWLKDNKHMPDDWQKQQRSASELIDTPRPKSDPPQFPQVNAQTTDEVIEKWGTEMTAWQEENNHIPNQRPADQTMQQMRGRRNQLAGQVGGVPVGGAVNNTQLNTLDAKVQALEVKLDRIISHFGVK